MPNNYEIIEIDMDEIKGAFCWLVRMIRDDIKPLSEVAGTKIDEVFLGSCMTNIGHFRAAGKLLDKHKGDLPTTLWVAPPTKMDQNQLMEEGYYGAFGKAGARMEMPGCSLCMGNQARVKEGATVVSTSTRNFPNRLGNGANVFFIFGWNWRRCAPSWAGSRPLRNTCSTLTRSVKPLTTLIDI